VAQSLAEIFDHVRSETAGYRVDLTPVAPTVEDPPTLDVAGSEDATMLTARRRRDTD
jgi:hypothetical protein